ncbi:MAG: hypothetical protein MN733_29310, partial [Nitrososphaera sp.]|nr:hypothetical protein [Nitrososphaera sp.]
MVHLEIPALLRDGNATAREYGILAGLLAHRARNHDEKDGQFNVLEVGTFDGLGTLQLAINSPDHAKVFTVDLPEGALPTLCQCSDLDLQYIGAARIGERFQKHAYAKRKVEQIR